MKDSIIINMRYSGYDLIDGKPNVERHHCLMGPDRAKAHHTSGKISAHQCKEMRVLLEMLAQVSYERDRCAEGMSKEAAREAFRERYGRSFL